MKFNLKNRPRSVISDAEYWNSLEEWFEGFEKELREWIENHTRRREDGSIFGEHPCVEVIKEILGEVKK